MTLKQYLRTHTWINPIIRRLFKVDNTDTQTASLKIVTVSLLSIIAEIEQIFTMR